MNAGLGRATLARVAAEAGVSIATVSKVLNGRPGVGGSTRRAVEQVIAEVGYVGVAGRSGVATRMREPVLEVIVETLDNHYTSRFVSGVMAAAQAAGGAVVTRLLSGIDAEPADWARRTLDAGRVGVIESTTRFSRVREDALHAVGLPLVLVDPLDEPRAEVHSVGATNWAGGLEATRHLTDLGHTRIAYIGGPRESGCNVARLHGYLAALHQGRIRSDPELITHGSFTFEHGLTSATILLARRGRPTAIFAGSDLVALGVLEAARRLGITTPDRLSVVGFDNSGAAASSAPPLTTVHQPVFEIGETAVGILLRLAAGETPPTRRVELATRLVERGSTARLPE